MTRDPAYWRKWRAEHPEYRERQTRLKRERRYKKGRGDRTKEYQNRPSRAKPRVEPLFPQLRRGVVLSFWNDELKMDLAQERELAILEGKDPEAVCKEYEQRETEWFALCGTPLMRFT